MCEIRAFFTRCNPSKLRINYYLIQKSGKQVYFWSTHTGAEIDLFWQDKAKNWGVEFKYADAPTLTKSMRIAVQDLELAHLWIVYPGNDKYPLAENISTLPLTMLSDFKVFS